jgi:hypothetical protein
MMLVMTMMMMAALTMIMELPYPNAIVAAPAAAAAVGAAAVGAAAVAAGVE